MEDTAVGGQTQQAPAGGWNEALAGLIELVGELRQRINVNEQQIRVLDDEVGQLAILLQQRKGKGAQA